MTSGTVGTASDIHTRVPQSGISVVTANARGVQRGRFRDPRCRDDDRRVPPAASIPPAVWRQVPVPFHGHAAGRI